MGTRDRLILLLLILTPILIVGAAIGAIGGVGWSRWSRPPPPAPVPTVPVVVAAVDLPPGEVIPRGALRVRWDPAPLVPAGLISTVDEAAGRVAIVPIAAGELVLESRLAP